MARLSAGPLGGLLRVVGEHPMVWDRPGPVGANIGEVRRDEVVMVLRVPDDGDEVLILAPGPTLGWVNERELEPAR